MTLPNSEAAMSIEDKGAMVLMTHQEVSAAAPQPTVSAPMVERVDEFVEDVQHRSEMT
jgi:hypothetical protein